MNAMEKNTLFGPVDRQIEYIREKGGFLLRSKSLSARSDETMGQEDAIGSLKRITQGTLTELFSIKNALEEQLSSQAAKRLTPFRPGPAVETSRPAKPMAGATVSFTTLVRASAQDPSAIIAESVGPGLEVRWEHRWANGRGAAAATASIPSLAWAGDGSPSARVDKVEAFWQVGRGPAGQERRPTGVPPQVHVAGGNVGPGDLMIRTDASQGYGVSDTMRTGCPLTAPAAAGGSHGAPGSVLSGLVFGGGDVALGAVAGPSGPGASSFRTLAFGQVLVRPSKSLTFGLSAVKPLLVPGSPFDTEETPRTASVAPESTGAAVALHGYASVGGKVHVSGWVQHRLLGQGPGEAGTRWQAMASSSGTSTANWDWTLGMGGHAGVTEDIGLEMQFRYRPGDGLSVGPGFRMTLDRNRLTDPKGFLQIRWDFC